MISTQLLMTTNQNNDPYWNNVSLLLHGNGNNGSTSFIDSSISPKTITRNGSAIISTSQQKFGGSSILLNASTQDSLSIPANTGFNFLNQPFTVEWWMYYLGPVSGFGGHIIDFRGSINGCLVFYVNNGRLYWVDDNLSGDNDTGITIPYGVWTYFAVIRNNTGLQFGKNGTVGSIIPYSKTFPSGNPVTIATRYNFPSNPLNYLTAYIDDLRITKNVARDITVVPSQQFPDS